MEEAARLLLDLLEVLVPHLPLSRRLLQGPPDEPSRYPLQHPEKWGSAQEEREESEDEGSLWKGSTYGSWVVVNEFDGFLVRQMLPEAIGGEDQELVLRAQDPRGYGGLRREHGSPERLRQPEPGERWIYTEFRPLQVCIPYGSRHLGRPSSSNRPERRLRRYLRDRRIKHNTAD